ncbi:MAG: ABC transporter ATP-binding protein [Patescibacteria group bacterium]|jgi:putative ABC transport system ATP-binding protein|nr:ABC transporter ATP-binding protein [Patescibacteria group bacterium]
MIEVLNLKKRFKTGDEEVDAVGDISFKIEQGELVCIVGQSGSGKTTLMNLLGGLDKPTGGQIEIDGQDIAKLNDHQLIKYRANKIGFIFQSYNLIPNLSALENVMIAMETTHKPKLNRKQRAVQLLREVGIDESQMKRKPSKLSGGQQQRVAVARALANKPRLILADEPTGNLDSATGDKVFELLKSLSYKEKTTIIVVTHDNSISEKSDRVIKIKDGKIIK